MTMSRVANKEQEYKLRRQFQHLQDDWDTYKQSIPRRSRRRRSCSSMTLMWDAAATLELLRNSPKRLMCSLQQIQTPAADFSRPEPRDQQEHAEMEVEVEVEAEIINDQRRNSTSRSRKLIRGGGRKLLEAFDGAVDETCGDGREETWSVSSSVLIQGAEPALTSSGSCISGGACPLMIDKHVKVTYATSLISDSSSSSSPQNIDGVEIWDLRRSSGDDGARGDVGVKGAKSLVLLPIAMITLAFVFMFVKGLTAEEYECWIVPT